MITESALVALAGLVAIVALLFLLITRFKWHVFLALLVPIVLFALIPGHRPAVVHRRLRAGLRTHDPEHRGGHRPRLGAGRGSETHRRHRADYRVDDPLGRRDAHAAGPDPERLRHRPRHLLRRRLRHPQPAGPFRRDQQRPEHERDGDGPGRRDAAHARHGASDARSAGRGGPGGGGHRQRNPVRRHRHPDRLAGRLGLRAGRRSRTSTRRPRASSSASRSSSRGARRSCRRPGAPTRRY